VHGLWRLGAHPRPAADRNRAPTRHPELSTHPRRGTGSTLAQAELVGDRLAEPSCPAAAPGSPRAPGALPPWRSGGRILAPSDASLGQLLRLRRWWWAVGPVRQ
jgi:hypothetical protein